MPVDGLSTPLRSNVKFKNWKIAQKPAKAFGVWRLRLDTEELLPVQPVFQSLLQKSFKEENNAGMYLDSQVWTWKKVMVFSISASKSNRRALFFPDDFREDVVDIWLYLYKHVILSIIWYSSISKWLSIKMTLSAWADWLMSCKDASVRKFGLNIVSSTCWYFCGCRSRQRRVKVEEEDLIAYLPNYCQIKLLF